MKPNKERLLKVIESVERRPEELFDMSSWVEKKSCGTAACAAGSYVLDNPGWGLRLEWRGRFAFIRDNSPVSASFDALGRHFELNEDDVFYLFDPGSYDKNNKSKTDVLARLRAFIAAIPDEADSTV